MTTSQLAIFGGMFDPPHNGHFLAACQVLEKIPEITKVIVIPAYRHAWKKGQAHAQHRLRMSQLAFGTNKNLEVSDLEIQRKGISYTVDTVDYYKQLQKIKHPVNIVIGSDGLSSLSRWKDYKRLVTMVRFIVVPRVGSQLENLPESAIVLSGESIVQTNISSTNIRTRVANKQSIAGLIPSSVEDYIIKNQLYL